MVYSSVKNKTGFSGHRRSLNRYPQRNIISMNLFDLIRSPTVTHCHSSLNVKFWCNCFRFRLCICLPFGNPYVTKCSLNLRVNVLISMKGTGKNFVSPKFSPIRGLQAEQSASSGWNPQSSAPKVRQANSRRDRGRPVDGDEILNSLNNRKLLATFDLAHYDANGDLL